MSHVFCIVGPTASGKSELAADVAVRLGGEVVNADAFQLYRGLDVLSGKPDSATLAKVRHHLLGAVPIGEEMSAAKYRELAMPVISEIISRGKLPVIVGGGGLYIKVLTHGLDPTPSVDRGLREELDALPIERLRERLGGLDPTGAAEIDTDNRRRLVRAIEICVLTGRPASEQRQQWKTRDVGGKSGAFDYLGMFVFRDRDDLYRRINKRVEAMLSHGAVEEVDSCGTISATAAQMIGVGEIQQLLNGEISLAECTTRIQQLTRRYAKRQLTWFRRQTNLESLNLSLLSYNEAVEWVTQRALARRMVND